MTTFGACSKHPNFAMVNCPLCEVERFELNNKISSAIFEQLKVADEPSEIDKSVMIKLTPQECLNLVIMGARYWSAALENNTTLTMENVCEFHYDLAISLLEKTDPDRFIKTPKP